MGLSDQAKKIEVFDILWNAPRIMTLADAVKLSEEKLRDGYWIIVDGQMYNNLDEIRDVIKYASKIAFMVPVGGG